MAATPSQALDRQELEVAGEPILDRAEDGQGADAEDDARGDEAVTDARGPFTTGETALEPVTQVVEPI